MKINIKKNVDLSNLLIFHSIAFIFKTTLQFICMLEIIENYKTKFKVEIRTRLLQTYFIFLSIFIMYSYSITNLDIVFYSIKKYTCILYLITYFHRVRLAIICKLKHMKLGVFFALISIVCIIEFVVAFYYSSKLAKLTIGKYKRISSKADIIKAHMIRCYLQSNIKILFLFLICSGIKKVLILSEKIFYRNEIAKNMSMRTCFIHDYTFFVKTIIDVIIMVVVNNRFHLEKASDRIFIGFMYFLGIIARLVLVFHDYEKDIKHIILNKILLDKDLLHFCGSFAYSIGLYYIIKDYNCLGSGLKEIYKENEN